MPKCSYVDCKSTTKSKCFKNLRFHPFPKPKTKPIKCMSWLELCGNKNLTMENITKNTYICEKHFDAGKCDPTGYQVRENFEIGAEQECGDSVQDQDVVIPSSLGNSPQNNQPTDHNYVKILKAKTAVNQGTQTVSRNLFGGHNIEENAVNQINNLRFNSLSTKSYFKYFTSLTVPQFEALFTFLDPTVMPKLKYTTKKTTPKKLKAIKQLSDKDKLCLTLIRLKRGYTLKELSIFYNISVAYVSIIFHTWVQFVYLQCCCLRNDLFKGSRNMPRNEMPFCFRSFKDNVTVILDGTEIKMQMSRNFQRQGNTHSSYKHCNTVKFLVGVSTKGAVIYNSEGYEGCISDNALFKSCDIHRFLEKGDVLMVDRGFTIQDFCDENQYKLIIPPFLAGRSRLTAEEELLTKKIAKARIHVERAIQRIKNFEFLAKPIRVSMLPLVSNIFSIICFLVNFEKPLVT